MSFRSLVVFTGEEDGWEILVVFHLEFPTYFNRGIVALVWEDKISSLDQPDHLIFGFGVTIIGILVRRLTEMSEGGERLRYFDAIVTNTATHVDEAGRVVSKTMQHSASSHRRPALIPT
jgi:hypothetical protein